MDIILASASPRRHELLKLITADFRISAADIDETLPSDIAPGQAAVYLARKKAEHISGKERGALVIGCDTTVLLDGTVFGKPADNEDAARMLKALSGNIHTVITGVCLSAYKEEKAVSRCFSESSEVEFYPLSDSEIAEYIATGEPLDKAGAYGIQGRGALLVKRISGDYLNIVGLPAARLKRELCAFIRENSLT
ncbi:MAG: septum formation protein Maf [Oscillospiraceae bacterium]|nr:septum formation protein Maf [Oscillospiraceae bacterium]